MRTRDAEETERRGGGGGSSRINKEKKKAGGTVTSLSLVFSSLGPLFLSITSPKNYKSSSCADLKKEKRNYCVTLAPPIRAHTHRREHARTQARAQLKSRNIRHWKSVFALSCRPQTLAMYCACAQRPRCLSGQASSFR